MSYRNCLACKEAGTKPKRGGSARLVFNPAITLPGPPTLEGDRLGAAFMATRVMHNGLAAEQHDYELTREQLLVVCWWAGLYAPQRRLRKHFGEWAELAARHLWYQCIQIPDPPVIERVGAI